jgi:hypothetical protein
MADSASEQTRNVLPRGYPRGISFLMRHGVVNNDKGKSKQCSHQGSKTFTSSSAVPKGRRLLAPRRLPSSSLLGAQTSPSFRRAHIFGV